MMMHRVVNRFGSFSLKLLVKLPTFQNCILLKFTFCKLCNINLYFKKELKRKNESKNFRLIRYYLHTLSLTAQGEINNYFICITSLSCVEPVQVQKTLNRTYWPSNLLTIEPIDHRTNWPSNLLTIEPIDHRTFWPSNLLTIEPCMQ